MKQEYIKLIEDFDKTLVVLKECWESAAPKEKAAHMERINKILDERLRLMKLRDQSSK